MAFVVNTNMLSYTTQRQMTKAQTTQQTAMTRLSSGLRINGAKDDAAGMSIANRMSSQISGINQAVRNANDGISLAQTAEGGLTDINTNLQRMRELAVQSSSSTNTASDRAALQQETKQLLSEIQRISNETDFNGIKLLNGSFQDKAFQIGANAGQTTNISIASASTKDLGSSVSSALNARGSASTTADAVSAAMRKGDVILNGVSVGASVAAADSQSFAAKSSSAIAKAAAFNEVAGNTGVNAIVNANEVQGASMVTTTTGAGTAQTGTIWINGIESGSITLSDGQDSTVSNRATVVQAINANSGRTGVTAVDSGSDSGGVKLVAADGRNIAIGYTGTLGNQTTGLNGITGATPTAVGTGTSNTDAGYMVHMGSITLSSAKAMKIEQGTGDITRAGVTEGTFEAQKAIASTRALASTANTKITAGDFRINGVLVGDSLKSYDRSSVPVSNADQSAIAKAAAVNQMSNLTGVTAKANTTVAEGTSMTAADTTGTLSINGVETASITTTTDAAESRRLLVKAINDISGQTGVKAIDTNDSTKGIRLEAADGRNIAIGVGTGGLTSASTGLNIDGGTTATPNITTGSITLNSVKAFTIESGTTGTDTTTTLGLQTGTYGGGRTGQSLETIDISTAEGASAAITAIDNAIASVDENRVNMGAFQNRFTSTVSALQTSSSNLTAARSRIQDADFAAESAEMSKSGILQQAATAMLAQANASSQGVLSLLR